jgi:hypothetical protein
MNVLLKPWQLLLFMDLATRRGHFAGLTIHPDED